MKTELKEKEILEAGNSLSIAHLPKGGLLREVNGDLEPLKKWGMRRGGKRGEGSTSSDTFASFRSLHILCLAT